MCRDISRRITRLLGGVTVECVAVLPGTGTAPLDARYFRAAQTNGPTKLACAAVPVPSISQDIMMTQNDTELTARLAREHGISEGAVTAVLDALRRGGGTMAQFSHVDFGGMSQWSSGMTMVGDMFNGSLKAKLNAIAGELSAYLRDHPAEGRNDDTNVSYRSAGLATAGSWWPDEFGSPSAAGSQNHMRYAAFNEKRRLVIDDHGNTIIYDTGDHRISGVSQSQSTDTTLTFVSQHGVVRVSDLHRVDAA